MGSELKEGVVVVEAAVGVKVGKEEGMEGMMEGKEEVTEAGKREVIEGGNEVDDGKVVGKVVGKEAGKLVVGGIHDVGAWAKAASASAKLTATATQNKKAINTMFSIFITSFWFWPYKLITQGGVQLAGIRKHI